MSHKEHKKFKCFKRIFLFLIMILILIGVLIFVFFKDEFLFMENSTASINNPDSNYSAKPQPAISANDSKYGIVKKDNNPDYAGVGQEQVTGKNGYFTTFSTASRVQSQADDSSIHVSTTASSNEKVYKEYKQNGTASWSQNPYWDGTMETDGCGITALSIVLSRIW